MRILQTGDTVPLACGHARTVAFNDPHDTDALFWCNPCDGLRAPLPVAAGEPGPMNPRTAFRVISDAIPEEVRGEELDEALRMLYRLADRAVKEN